MQKIEAIIVDDEKGNCENIRALLCKYCPQVEIISECYSIDTAYETIVVNKPQLVFLDIELIEGTGFELLESLPEINFEVIFVTAFDKYALKAIKFCALDYLLKPLNIKELVKAVIKVESRIKEKQANDRMQYLLENMSDASKRIALPLTDKIEFIEINQIVRLEGEGNYTHVFLTSGEKFFVCKPMKEFDDLLSDYNFLRVHRSHLINLDEVKTYIKTEGGYIKMKDGSSVSISRQRKNMVVSRLKA